MINYVYVVTEINYGEFCIDNDTIETLRVFNDKTKAIKYVENLINCRKKIFQLDECYDNQVEIDKVIRFFDTYQDNWNAYFEICVKKVILD